MQKRGRSSTDDGSATDDDSAYQLLPGAVQLPPGAVQLLPGEDIDNWHVLPDASTTIPADGRLKLYEELTEAQETHIASLVAELTRQQTTNAALRQQLDEQTKTEDADVDDTYLIGQVQQLQQENMALQLQLQQFQTPPPLQLQQFQAPPHSARSKRDRTYEEAEATEEPQIAAPSSEWYSAETLGDYERVKLDLESCRQEIFRLQTENSNHFLLFDAIDDNGLTEEQVTIFLSKLKYLKTYPDMSAEGILNAAYLVLDELKKANKDAFKITSIINSDDTQEDLERILDSHDITIDDLDSTIQSGKDYTEFKRELLVAGYPATNILETLNHFRTTTEELQTRLNTLQQGLVELRLTPENFVQQIKQFYEETARLTTAHAALNDSFVALQSQSSETATELTTLRQSNAELQSRSTATIAEIAEKAAELSASNAALAQANANRDSIATELAALKVSHDALQSQSSETAAELATELAALRQSNAELQSRSTATTAEIAEKAAELSASNAALVQANANRDSIAAELQQTKEQVNALTASNAALQAQIATTDAESTASAAAISAELLLTKQQLPVLLEAKAQHDALVARLASVQLTPDAVVGAVQALQQQLANANARTQVLSDALANFGLNAETVIPAMEALTAFKSQFTGLLHALEKAGITPDAVLTRLTSDAETIQRLRATSLDGELAKLQNRLAATTTENNRLLVNNTALTRQLAVQREKRQTLKEHLRGLPAATAASSQISQCRQMQARAMEAEAKLAALQTESAAAAQAHERELLALRGELEQRQASPPGDAAAAANSTDELRAQYDALRARAEAANEVFERKSAHTQNRIARLEAELARHIQAEQTASTAAQAAAEAATAAIGDLRVQLDAAAVMNTTAEANVLAAEAAVQKADARAAEQRRRHAAVKHQFAQFRVETDGRIAALTERVRQLMGVVHVTDEPAAMPDQMFGVFRMLLSSDQYAWAVAAAEADPTPQLLQMLHTAPDTQKAAAVYPAAAEAAVADFARYVRHIMRSVASHWQDALANLAKPARMKTMLGLQSSRDLFKAVSTRMYVQRDTLLRGPPDVAVFKHVNAQLGWPLMQQPDSVPPAQKP